MCLACWGEEAAGALTGNVRVQGMMMGGPPMAPPVQDVSTFAPLLPLRLLVLPVCIANDVPGVLGRRGG